ncbi:MAG: hypothetical protein ABGY71_00030 [bacterium]|jgi:hypothetical protein|nr:hypothetical protein [Planctomycetota bacterium]HIL52289.1 hypothetical protein [Planctomycetota bacterium]
MSLQDMLRAEACPQDISRHLDALDHAQRLAEVQSLAPRDLRQLYALCASQPADLPDFVPVEVPNGVPVRHFGINSLPLFRHFEKRFLRSGPEQLTGYNHQALSPITGPGYFTVSAPEPNAPVAIDYRLIPSELPHPSWPPLASNERFPAVLVFGHMRDFVLRVSRQVTIGRAEKKGRLQRAWFALVRGEEGQAESR